MYRLSGQTTARTVRVLVNELIHVIGRCERTLRHEGDGEESEDEDGTEEEHGDVRRVERA